MAVTSQQAIASLNAQREANGLPGGIVENPEWSEGCRLHMHYTELNGGIDPSDPHDEDPNKPGFTTLGQEAAQSAVLGAGFGPEGSNGWAEAPMHLMQTLGPALSETGYADGCLWTWPGYKRTPPSAPATYSYPNGTVIRPTETAREWPLTPGALVGIPEGTPTGPYLFVFVFKQEFDQLHLTSATLTGPSGPVEVRTVDNLTPEAGGYLPMGGIIIPVVPLSPESLYTATAQGVGHEFEGLPESWSWSWSFRTGPPDPVLGTPNTEHEALSLVVEARGMRVRLTSLSTNRIDLKVMSLPSRNLVWSTAVEMTHRGATVVLPHRLRGLRYEACAEQTVSYTIEKGTACDTSVWLAGSRARWGKLRVRRRSAVLDLVAAYAKGQMATLAFKTRASRTIRRSVRLGTSLVLRVQRGTTVTVSIPAFSSGGLHYSATRLTRFIR